MKRRPRQRLVAEINITPLTDVILVLLIIFMVTTPLVFQSSIQIDLPKSKSTEEPPAREITVAIDANGQAFLGNKQYSLRFDLDLLKFELSSMIKNKKNTTILIRGDKNVQYDFVIKVMDMASQLGIKKIVLLTELTR